MLQEFHLYVTSLSLGDPVFQEYEVLFFGIRMGF